MRASATAASSRPARPFAAWLARAHQLFADIVLPGRLGYGVVSPREIDER
jgi:hypothetical protein